MKLPSNSLMLIVAITGLIAPGCATSPRSDDEAIGPGVTAQPLQVDTTAIVKAVQSQLMDWLSAVPVGREEDYGFESRADFGNAVLSDPYEVFSVSSDGAVAPLKTWKVPIGVDGRFRLLAEVRESGAAYNFVGIGSAPLANELDKVEVAGVGRASKRKSILRSYKQLVDFVTYDVEPTDLKSNKKRAVVPLSSARSALSDKATRIPGQKGPLLDAQPLTIDEVATLLAD